MLSYLYEVSLTLSVSVTSNQLMAIAAEKSRLEVSQLHVLATIKTTIATSSATSGIRTPISLLH